MTKMMQCDKHGLTEECCIEVREGHFKTLCRKCLVNSMVPIRPLCPIYHESLDKNGYCQMCEKTHDICTSSYGKYRCTKLQGHDGNHISAYLYEWTDKDAKRFDIKYECTGCFRRYKPEDDNQ